MIRSVCLRLALLAMAIVVAVSAPGACAATAYDFSGLSLEELYEVRSQLDAEILEAERASGMQVYESGSYVVGTDIPAGDYVLVENSDAVFASVIVRSGSSEDADLVAYHLINNRAVIRLRAGTWLTLSEATACPLGMAGDYLMGKLSGEGGYLVGSMLPAGRYIVSPMEKAPLSSYSVYDGILGTDARLTKFEALSDNVEIELGEGDYIELSGCTIDMPE